MRKFRYILILTLINFLVYVNKRVESILRAIKVENKNTKA